ncbi:hypothetical protein [Coleofasciculus sp. FACHB-T130]|uniref:hypothetical protein n=1 Tax=Cyanophyceae TaxID=3028117 RepID=UPI0016875C95|nr:hypothetical protein [Coleofasciculus sp. FACHB-T130]MBD1878312.1 hypothetical protein [Coleofasciculus sp. FACHB-T130]
MKTNVSWLYFQRLPAFLKVFLLAAALVTTSFILQSNIGINLGDEGFLWYGTIHTALGEVPIRDFQSYDPGRYYWGAAWFKIFGNDSILSLRISTAIFQTIGLAFGLLSLKRVTQSWWLLAIEGLLLLLWMFPRHKLFEPSIAMAAVYFGILLLERPSLLRHFIAGVFVGLAAFLGRNHGLYAFLSFLLLIFFTWAKLGRNDIFRRFVAWGCGILMGYSPMFFMLFVVPGFFESFVDSIKFLFRLGGTNLPLPVPWVWYPNYSEMNLIQAANAFSIGIFFLILPLFNTLILIQLFLSKRDALRLKHPLIASTFVSFLYMHYAFSRADLGHLAQAIHPLLIGLMCLPSMFRGNFKKKANTGLLSITFAATLLSVGLVSPYYLRVTAPPEQYVQRSVTGDTLWMDVATANLIDTVIKINNQLIQPNEGLLIAPHWPTFYPIVQRKSPIWDIYLLFPEVEDRQKTMIEELRKKNVNWIILGDIALDGRDELRFKNTHPLLWNHFQEDFEVIGTKSLPDNYELLQRKE